MVENTLQITNLSKKIGNKKIIKNVSIEVKKGEIFGLLGPNGAGKTTIIRMIVGLIKRDNGSVIINGHDLDQSFELALNEVGAIVETPVFYDYMSGMKNLMNYARMSLKDNISIERVNKVVKLVQLENSIHEKVKKYSLGMRQRLGVAQALLHNPSLLILDEPTNGLDPKGIKDFREYLRKLADKGMSVLISSHLLSEMQLMCDRFSIIENGKLTYTSTIGEDNINNQLKPVPVEFEISDINKAVKLLKEIEKNNTINVNQELSEITTNLKRDSIAEINRLFVKNNINVYRISVKKATLEDRFLELTNQEVEEFL